MVVVVARPREADGNVARQLVRISRRAPKETGTMTRPEDASAVLFLPPLYNLETGKKVFLSCGG